MTDDCEYTAKFNAPVPFDDARTRRQKNKAATVALREAILQAADLAGGDASEDGKYPGGLVGYLTILARTEPGVFGSLLSKTMPAQVAGHDGEGVADPLAELMQHVMKNGKHILDK